MKVAFFIMVSFVISTLSIAAPIQPLFVKASNHAIQYVGRFDFSKQDSPVFMYAGSAIRTAFTGTALAIRLQDDSVRNWFTVVLDDSVFSFAADKKDGLYQLAKNLLNKKHTIEIFRRTECHGGNSQFLGFYIDAGKKLLPLKKRRFSFEFIGDSWTCGYGNECKSTYDHYGYATQNAYQTYGAIAARAFNANFICIARSGIGVCQGYGGNSSYSMSGLYDEVINNSELSWNYKVYQPKIVFIDLGGNDFSASMDSLKFATAYSNFMQRIRKNYPMAALVCMASTNKKDNKWLLLQHCIKNCVMEAEKKDSAVYYFEFTLFKPQGCDWHPAVAEHQEKSTELIAFIKTILLKN